LGRTHQLFAFAGDVNIVGENIPKEKHRSSILDAAKEVGLEVKL
jgi:hypothetical protein